MVKLVKEYKAALYLRLSKEDGDKNESDSISNQRMMLLNFIENDKSLKFYDCYIDDGYSGTNLVEVR